VIGDTHGTVLHLWERDCSTQRRHQKVLEEAPAPTINAHQRARLTAAAVDLARETGYVGAGTAEFLLDAATGEFYFLEMNTRLQVEHPVTEAITGLDLVELQLIIADGQPLPLTQADVTSTGHAIEARVYAEDAFGGFLPQAGTASYVHWPEGLARVDHALESGQVVSTAYDPMLGKIIVHGHDRETARRGLIAALDQTAIMGLTTNAGFLRALVASRVFRDATIDTAWLDHHEVAPPDVTEARALGAWASARRLLRDPSTPFSADGFRLGADQAPVRIVLDRPVLVAPGAGVTDGLPLHELTIEAAEDDGVVRIEAAVGTDDRVTAFVRELGRGAEVACRGQRHVLAPASRADAGSAGSAGGAVLAPMPGTMLDVRVSVGQQVAEGDILGVLEAMKMEAPLKAPCDGIVTSVGPTVGDQVALGARLFEVAARESGKKGS
jgi:3-methylcrotonyl-CoA carboxylase alpha subunit/acetyl-CoA/propionyl-CoA carboxylase biotin carboxyl carrier protein